MSKTKILLEGMGIDPLEKIDNNVDSYWTLYELIDHCTEQLSIPVVVGQSEQLRFLIDKFQTPKGNYLIDLLMEHKESKEKP